MLPDLSEVEKKLNESRRLFVATVDSYDDKAAGDGHFIVSEFLSQFQKEHPDRAKIAQEQAAEAVRLIKAFGEVRTRFTEHVMMINLQMQQELLSLFVGILRLPSDLLKSSPTAKDPSNDPLGWLLETRDTFRKLGDAVAAEVLDGTRDAISVAEYVINIQNVASGLLKNRERTLTGFRENHFDWSWRQIPKAIKAEFKGEGAWEVSADVAVKLTHLVAEFVPFAALWRAGKVVYSAAKPEEHKARPGDTDLMQILLQQLRDENDAFEGLDKMYGEASIQLDQIAQRTRKS